MAPARCCSTRPRPAHASSAGDAPAGEPVWVETAHLVGDPTAPGAPRGPRLHDAAHLPPHGHRPRAPEIPAPSWPAGLELRPFDPERHGPAAEGRARRGVRRRVGPRDSATTTRGPSGSSGVPQFDPELVLVVWDGDEIAAMALNYQKRLGDWGWIALLGVRPAWRRQGSGWRCSRRASAASPSGARRWPRSASTARTRPARRASTSGPGCASSGAPTSGEGAARASAVRGRNVRREHAPRPLPRLPDVHRRRDRRRVPVPQLRPRVRRRARPRPACLGRRRRDDGRGRLARAAVSRGGGDRGGRRSRIRSPRRSATCPARPLVLGGCCCAHVGAIRGLAARPAGSRSSGSMPTATSTRPRRRPRATSGGCRCGWRSTPAPSRPATSRSSAPGTSIRPRSPT